MSGENARQQGTSVQLPKSPRIGVPSGAAGASANAPNLPNWRGSDVIGDDRLAGQRIRLRVRSTCVRGHPGGAARVATAVVRSNALRPDERLVVLLAGVTGAVVDVVVGAGVILCWPVAAICGLG
jgi:hypothetical protein